MKRTFKVLGFIGLMLVIGFSFVACSGGDDDGGSSGGGTGGGGNIVSGATLIYPDGMADADKPIDFSYINYENVLKTSPLLIDAINPPASVKISGGKLTINLGIPKDEYMRDIGVGAKVARFAGFFTSDKRYGLVCVREGTTPQDTSNGWAALVYAEKDATNGVLSIKKGWNYVYSRGGEEFDESSVSKPNDFTWTVFDYWN